MSISDNGNKRILIVEDYPAMSYSLSVLLQEFGPVEIAANGKDALLKGPLNCFDAIISDINMPEMDGIEFYKAAVELDTEVKRRFLFFTSSFQEEHLSFFIDNDIQFLFKPTNIKEITKALEEIFNNESERVAK